MELKNERKKSNDDKSLARTLMVSMINHLHRNGELSDIDLKNNKVVQKKVLDYLKKNEKNIDLEFVVDYRDDILKIANQFNNEGHDELAMTLYATFIEHTLNKIISLQCSIKKLDDKSKTEIIRNISISGKCTWLLKLLELPPIKPNYVRTIIQIAEERNAYIHYKWKPAKSDNSKSTNELEEKKFSEKKEGIKKLVRYLKTYDSKLQYKGKKARFKTLAH